MIPVVTIDGPSGVGKGSVSQLLAQALQWHFLDSGALYRVLALAAHQQGIELANAEALAQFALHMPVSFRVDNSQLEPDVFLGEKNISQLIRTPECGQMASQIAAYPEVRQGLLERQRAFLQPPGLIADGRDMGTVVFPDATIKFFLVASAAQRAQRRYKQLKEKGINVNLPDLFADIEERDKRDRERAASPLIPAVDAIVIDTTLLSLADVFNRVLAAVKQTIGE